MRIFLTGASGWIGSAAVDELRPAGHELAGLARSDTSADALAANGVRVVRGTLEDLEVIRAEAEAADAVVHLGFVHDFTRFADSGLIERAVVQTVADTLAGSGRPFLLASGVAGIRPGRLAREEDLSSHVGPDSARGGAENLALEYVERGVRVVPLRFAASVHGPGDHGFLAELVRVARATGVAGYVGDGSARWPAVARSDVGAFIRLALEHAPAGQPVHAVAEEGIATRDIAQAIADALGVPTASVDPADAESHFGWIGRFFALDIPASSARTRELLGWRPTGRTLIEDVPAYV
jgi:nucleoside-diphosphate-sugar epimerase